MTIFFGFDTIQKGEIMEKTNNIKSDNDIFFANTTNLDANQITTFQLFALKKYHIFISIMITVVFGGLGIGLIFVNEFVGTAVLLAGIIGGLFLFPYMMKDQIKKQNQVFQENDYKNTFLFYQDKLLVLNQDVKKEKEYRQEFLYQELFRVDEYTQVVYIFINKNQGFILDKTKMTKGTIGETIEFLKTKGVKYKDKKSLGDIKKNKII